ncbi:transcriptional regulator family: Helix-turn-helix and Homeodomain-like HTH [Penicillium cosmopolitanum]|uniref:Transcriptional regulator family: Helix-turn-helix and Homeodomain-like HTH n=1 Tax=Penicillium cosmopolitanum TaxID=1131564 RepID=A0A9W9W0T4_9EURO|nr:transcriptional regulator family: Helix-turn-helix and Homeodomain-like HTH [Penicillium cosmopolitanum]KAJ5396456.1 transcriptional regulator family: Helix-turn-helix and Homeodomain-like HTH [Penicillium cosmopolitanum]
MESIAQKTKDRKKGTELSSEARSAIIDAYESGISASKIASDFGVSRATVYTTLERFKQHQTTKSLPRGGAPAKFTRAAVRSICLLVRRKPGLVILSLAPRYLAIHGALQFAEFYVDTTSNAPSQDVVCQLRRPWLGKDSYTRLQWILSIPKRL